MADLVGKKKRLTINLSLFASNHQSQSNNENRSTKSTIKSPKHFQPDEVVGLAIVAAISEFDQTHDRFLSAKSSRAAIASVSPRSTPIPIVTVNSSSGSAKFGGGGPKLGEKMKFSDEEYTCVISHVGNNMIRKFEYFDDNLANGSENTTKYCLGSEVLSDFLNSCYLCKKKLHGLDIFMYRGEKAFCSAECRCTQISIDEHKEKCGSGVMKPFEYSVSPCSGPMQFFTGVAAA